MSPALRRGAHRPFTQWHNILAVSIMTVAASLFYGFLAMLLPQLLAQSPSRRRAIFAGAASAPLLMATSRVYLGVHYLIDVLASMLAGVMWLALSVALLRRLQRPRTEKLSAPA